MNKRGNRVIAIVDDDDSVRRAVRSLLASRNYRVKTYDSAEAFLLSSHRGDTGCLVLDLHMCGMGGLDLLKAQQMEVQPVPTIVLTGHGGDRARDECLRAGAFAFLHKPFNARALCATVEAAMPRAQVARTDESLADAATDR
jgi:FixJ family two-component response regulator